LLKNTVRSVFLLVLVLVGLVLFLTAVGIGERDIGGTESLFLKLEGATNGNLPAAIDLLIVVALIAIVIGREILDHLSEVVIRFWSRLMDVLMGANSDWSGEKPEKRPALALSFLLILVTFLLSRVVVHTAH
jgi:hypothetical protein